MDHKEKRSPVVRFPAGSGVDSCTSLWLRFPLGDDPKWHSGCKWVSRHSWGELGDLGARGVLQKSPSLLGVLEQL